MVAGATLAQVKAALQAHGYGSDTDAAQTELINSVYRRILSMRRWTFLEKTTTISVARDQATVPVPTADLAQIKSVRLLVDGTYTPLEFLPAEELQDAYVADTALGEPAYWSRQGDSILLQPDPDRAYQLAVVYYYLPPNLVAGSDVLVIPRGFEDVVVWNAVMKMAFRQRDWGAHQTAKNEFNEAIKEMVDAFGKEQAQSSRQVRRWAGWD